jgi:large subunit ribosomal protein L28e
MNQSPELVWALLKKQNRFVIKRDGVTFSAEPGNVRNLNKFKYSGLAPRRIISVEPGPKSDVILLIKRKGHGHKPSTNFARIVLRKDPRRVNNAVRKFVKKHRPDLLHDILARVTRIRMSQKSRLSGGVPKSTKKPQAKK